MAAPRPRKVNKAIANKSSPKNLWTPRGLVGQTNMKHQKIVKFNVRQKSDIPAKGNTVWECIAKKMNATP